MLPRNALVIAFAIFALTGFLAQPIAAATVPKTVSTGKLFRAQGDEGWVGFSGTITFTSLAPVGSTAYFLALNLKPGDELGSGYGVRGGNITVTGVDDKQVSASVTVPVLGTATGYVYVPGYYSPNTVTGVDSWNWKDGNKTLVFTKSSSGTVIIRWDSPETDTVLWGRVFPDTFTILGLLAIVLPAAFLVSVLIGGKDPMQVIGLVSAMTLIALAALIVANAMLAFS